MGDFNAEISNKYVNEFCMTYKLNSLIKEPTCFKNIENPTCIDLIITNRPRSFCHSTAIETGLSDFHKLTITVLRSNFAKLKPKIIHFRAFRKFCNFAFREDLLKELFTNDISPAQLNSFKDTVLRVIGRHAPRKKKYVRNNQANFMNTDLNKAIMKRS